MKTLLIPGYATQLRASVFRSPLPQHEGFVAFQSAIDSGEAEVFHWGINQNLTLLQSLNPFSYLTLYRDEEALAHTEKTQRNLHNLITTSEPKHIICHTMGCRLLLNTINVLGLPPSVQSIIFLQADIDSDAAYNVQRPTHDVPLSNYYCPWDPSLIVSSILHRTIRIGMRAWNHAGVQNHFYPLLKPINLHTSPLRDTVFVQKNVK